MAAPWLFRSLSNATDIAVSMPDHLSTSLPGVRNSELEPLVAQESRVLRMNVTALIIVCSVIVIAVVTIAAPSFFRKRRSKKLRTRFGGAEYDRALQEGGSRRQAEAGLDRRTVRVE